jgi:hypothetical protein
MRRIASTALRGLLLSLVALTATGAQSHAQPPEHDQAVAQQESAVAKPPSPDGLERSIERPLPFLAGQGALEALLEINPRVNLRSTGRTGDTIEDGSDASAACLSQLRARLAVWQQATAGRACAFAVRGTLHSFSTPPPVSLS